MAVASQCRDSTHSRPWRHVTSKAAGRSTAGAAASGACEGHLECDAGDGQTWQHTIPFSDRYSIAANLYRLPDLAHPYRNVTNGDGEPWIMINLRLATLPQGPFAEAKLSTEPCAGREIALSGAGKRCNGPDWLTRQIPIAEAS